MRAPSPAFSRRQRSGSENEGEGDDPDPSQDVTMTEGKPLEASDVETQPITALPPELATQPVNALPRPDPKDLPEIEPPPPGTEPWPDATPQPMRPVEPGSEVRKSRATVAMPVSPDFGRPPAMPKSTAPPPLALGLVENPAHMPGPKEVPSGDPDDPAPAPGVVPPGDSRSLRKGDEFVLIYRVGTCVISRTGKVGTRGQWRVVEYPTSAFASNSYAKECSRFVSEGFTDYRE